MTPVDFTQSSDVEGLSRRVCAALDAARSLTLAPRRSGSPPQPIDPSAIAAAMARAVEDASPESVMIPDEWRYEPLHNIAAFQSLVPQWSTMAALVRDGETVACGADWPMWDTRCIQVGRTLFVTINGEACGPTPPRCAGLGAATLATSTLLQFEGGKAGGFGLLRAGAGRTLVAGGAQAWPVFVTARVDLVVETGLTPAAAACLAGLARSAGGACASWRGARDVTAGGDVVAAATPELLDQAVEVLARAGR